MMGGVQEENGKAANGWLVIGNGVLLNQSGLIKVKGCFIHITFGSSGTTNLLQLMLRA